jgi:gamma-butyrobetaine dioxygenase|tara:strand:- start:8 stop:550 length:543 start_codon:yes stop_codon:yes gene_type:complete
MRAMHVADEVLGLFAAHGGNTYAEQVSMEQHALQAAALARASGASDALVLAALLHDVGHFLAQPDSEFGVTDHGTTGGAWLAERFEPAVSEPVRLHVAAKRFRCFVDPAYEEQLSSASVGTLRLQGGAMSAAEAREFEAEPFAQDALALRSFDDGGKVAGLEIPALDEWRPLLDSPGFRL